MALPSVVYGPVAGSGTEPSALGIRPVMTDIDECSWPATTDSTPRNSGWFFNAARYSSSGYWNSCSACQRYMSWFGAAPETRPLGVIDGLLFCQVLVGPSGSPLVAVATG